MTSTNQRDDYQNFPWLIFKLNDQLYALNCRHVVTIQNKPTELVPALEAPDYVSGLMNVRGEILPLISTRRLFGMFSQLEAGNEFAQLIDKVKNEHGEYISLLETCIKKRTKVVFPTSVEELSLYQWIQKYHSENQKLMAQLQLAIEPLNALFEASMSIIQCSNQCAICARPECQYTVLKKIKEEHAPRIINVLEECKRIYVESSGDKVIILKNSDYSVGYSIDDVIAVEEIVVISTASNTRSIESSKYLYGVGTRAQDKEEKIILLLDDQALIETIDDYTSVH